MSIFLKEQVDKSVKELSSALDNMECLYLSVYDIMMSLCHLAQTSANYSSELENGIKHVQQVYFNLVAEVRGAHSPSGFINFSPSGLMVSVYTG